MALRPVGELGWQALIVHESGYYSVMVVEGLLNVRLYELRPRPGEKAPRARELMHEDLSEVMLETAASTIGAHMRGVRDA